jgi:nitrate reductase NapAB chaperone NapD
MNFSGILVSADVEHLDTVCRGLGALEGVEIHAVDRQGGRIVVVQEAADVDAEVAGFMRIRTLPHVLSADLVCHYFGSQPVTEPDIASALRALQAPPPRNEARQA